MNRKIMSILLSLALLTACMPMTSVLASAADWYYINMDFEDVSDFGEFLAKSEVVKENLKEGTTGTMSIADIPGRGNVLVSRFSDKFNGEEENNSIQLRLNQPVLLENNKVVMEAKVYTTAASNQAIRLFEHTWSSGNQASDALVVLQNGQIQGANGEEGKDLAPYELNKWYHILVVVKSTANPSERTYDVYVDGICKGSNLKRGKAFVKEDGNSISYINVGHRAWDDGYSYIDDVKIYEYPGLVVESGSITNNQQNVPPVTKEITLKFTAPLNSATIDGIKLKDSDENEVKIASETDSLDKSVLNIKINEELKSGKNYTLTFEGISGVLGEFYNDVITFKTGAPMMNMTSIPTDGTIDADVWGDIVLTFDNPLNPATFDKSKIEISGLDKNDFNAELTGANVITISLNKPLYERTEYAVTLSDTILSTKATGSKKIFNKSFGFVTEVSGKFVDEFDNYVYKMYDHSKRTTDGKPNFTVSETANNNVDNNVITIAYNEAPAYIIYNIEEGIHSFRLDKHVGNSQRPDKDGPVKIYVASDYNKETGDGNWIEVTPSEELIEVPGLASFLTAYKHEIKNGVPEGSKYLKIEICIPDVPPADNDGYVNIWSPELSKIEINHVPVFELACTSPEVIDKGDWIYLDFTSAVNGSAITDAITVTKDENSLEIKDTILAEFGKRVKLKVTGGLDENSEYKVTIAPDKLTGATGISFTGSNEVVFRVGIKKYQLRAQFLSGTDIIENTVDGTITVEGSVLSKESNAQIVIARYNEEEVLVDIKAPSQFSMGYEINSFREVLTGCRLTDTIKVFCFDSLDTIGYLGECEVLKPIQ